MTTLCCDVLQSLRAKGMTLATAESLTGGGIGAALTAVPGASDVFKGGVICYMDYVKERILGVSPDVLESDGAVSAPTAEAMAVGVRRLLAADVSLSVTGLAGPGGDDFGHPVGTVYIGFSDGKKTLVKECHFEGSREEIRNQTISVALLLVLENI